MRTLAIVLIAVLSVACGTSASQRGGAGSSREPAAATWAGETPVGLFFMTRFWAASGSLEKAVWYFAPDRTVYRNLGTGFSPEDLAAHRGPRGTATRDADRLVITWADGKKTSARFSTTATGFGWDAGIFTPVAPIRNAAALAGVYEGGNSVSSGGGAAATARTIQFDPNGSYRTSGTSAISSSSARSDVTAGSSGTGAGTWTADAYSITMTDGAGTRTRLTAFPYDDPDTAVKPDYLFLGGTMYRHR